MVPSRRMNIFPVPGSMFSPQTLHVRMSTMGLPLRELLRLALGLEEHEDIALADGADGVPGDDPPLVRPVQDPALHLHRLTVHAGAPDDLDDLGRCRVSRHEPFIP